jgi:hypothetical protein
VIPGIKRSSIVLAFLLLVAVATLSTWPAAQGAQAPSGEGCASTASASAAGAQKGGVHAYFDALAARTDCMAAFSLRDNAQLAKYTHGPNRLGQRVVYEPAKDSDPRKQDAAKIVVPAGEVSLRTTVRLPIFTTDGTATLVTWDAWFGNEFQYGNTGIGTYKTFQFASPAKRIWFEVRTRFKLSEAPRGAGRGAAAPRGKRAGGKRDDRRSGNQSAEPVAPAPPAKVDRTIRKVDIGQVDTRAYGPPGTALGPNITKGTPLSPQVGNFTVRSETWTRYWVLIEQRKDDWDLVSLWVADEDHDAVQIIDKRQLSVKGSVESFWLEYNTSSENREALGERTGYARNVVMLKNVADVRSLFQRPVK